MAPASCDAPGIYTPGTAIMQDGFAILLFWAVVIAIWLFYRLTTGLTTADERRGWYLDFMPILGFLLFVAGIMEAYQSLF